MNVRRFLGRTIGGTAAGVTTFKNALAISGNAVKVISSALHQFADAYPDPKNGANTAISSALDVKFTQVSSNIPP